MCVEIRSRSLREDKEADTTQAQNLARVSCKYADKQLNTTWLDHKTINSS